MKIEKVKGRFNAEYEKVGKKIYRDVTDEIPQGKSYLEKIPDEEKPSELKGKSKLPDEVPDEVAEKVRGVNGFSKMPKTEQEKEMKRRLGLSE